MPMSNPWHLAPVLHYVSALQPKRVLDVGVGLGTYGFMIRQYLDIGHERLDRANWQLTIDGVEIFEPYRNAVWDFAYNRIHMGDVLDLLPSLESYDVILCNDVLEHFEKDKAVALVNSLLRLAPVVIATTPNREWPQGTWAGNEAETHLCLLGAEDMPHLVGQQTTGPTSCFVSANTPAAIEMMRKADLSCPRLTGSKSSTLGHRIQSKLQRMLAGK